MTRNLISLSLMVLGTLGGLIPCHAETLDADPSELMRLAFPDWVPGTAPRIEASGPNGKPTWVAVTPRLVMPLDASHKALVLSGVEVDRETESLMNSHANAANLGVYVFERRNGQWIKTYEVRSAGWHGFIGQLGTLKPVTLGADRVGLAVENGSCWQGMCGQWLAVYEITPRRARKVAELMTGSKSLAFLEECPNWLDGRLLTVPESFKPDYCFDVSGQWQLVVPPGRKQADIVIHFTGRDAVIDRRTAKPAVKRINETLVLRAGARSYAVLRGRNPTHRF